MRSLIQGNEYAEMRKVITGGEKRGKAMFSISSPGIARHQILVSYIPKVLPERTAVVSVPGYTVSNAFICRVLRNFLWMF